MQGPVDSLEPGLTLLTEAVVPDSGKSPFGDLLCLVGAQAVLPASFVLADGAQGERAVKVKPNSAAIFP